ncbi:MAG: ABC transporter permease [Chloroflexota bacterium]
MLARKRPSFAVQLFDLTLIQLANWRWAWRSTLLSGIIAPLFTLIALGIFARDAGSETLTYILTGNVVLSLMFENLDRVSSNFAFMKAMGTLNYFATLPVSRYAVVLATLVAFFLLSLPATLTTIFFGSWYLAVPLNVSPLILLVMPLIALPLASLGALIGTMARSPMEAGPITSVIVLILAGLGPVIFPPSRLPEFMVQIGRLSPATYAASALRQTLIGPVTWQLAIDLVALILLALIMGWLVNRKMNWHQYQ